MNIIQVIEQAQAMLRDFSPLLWSYYEELQKQGFTAEQAFELVKDYQKVTLGRTNNE